MIWKRLTHGYMGFAVLGEKIENYTFNAEAGLPLYCNSFLKNRKLSWKHKKTLK